jgi:hypothetical protein
VNAVACRLVALTADQSAAVISRLCLGHKRVTCIAISSSHVLAAAVEGQGIWFVSLGDAAEPSVLGCHAMSDPVISIAWLPGSYSRSGQAVIMASTAAGTLVQLTAPVGRARDASTLLLAKEEVQPRVARTEVALRQVRAGALVLCAGALVLLQCAWTWHTCQQLGSGRLQPCWCCASLHVSMPAASHMLRHLTSLSLMPFVRSDGRTRGSNSFLLPLQLVAGAGPAAAVYARGADHHVHLVQLPEAAAAWDGAGGKLLKSSIKVGSCTAGCCGNCLQQQPTSDLELLSTQVTASARPRGRLTMCMHEFTIMA